MKKKKVGIALIISAGIFAFQALIVALKVMAIVALCVIIGGVGLITYGVRSFRKVSYYESSMTFYVNPVAYTNGEDGDSSYSTYGAYPSNVMNNIVKLLESQGFAEIVLDEMMKNVTDPVVASALPSEKYGSNFYGLSEEYTQWVNLLCDATEFSFQQNDTVAESFIDVKISIKDEKDRTDEEAIVLAIHKQVAVSADEFIEEIMPVPSGYASTKCVVVSQQGPKIVVYRNGKKVK